MSNKGGRREPKGKSCFDVAFVLHKSDLRRVHSYNRAVKIAREVCIIFVSVLLFVGFRGFGTMMLPNIFRGRYRTGPRRLKWN